MRNLLLIVLVVIVTTFAGIVWTQKRYDRKYLYKEFKDKTHYLNDNQNWRNQLREEFGKNIQSLPETVKNAIIERADKDIKQQWEPLLAMEFLEYKINGNRNHYEGKNFNRRDKLMNLILAELLTQKSKYINQIANGVWLLLEESTWTWPAHIGMQKAGEGLPDPQQYIIDLGAGESSAYISWIRLLLGEQLAKLSPMFVKRIDYELDKRIVEDFLHTDFKSWMGFEGQHVNNWNIWINTNMLMTALLTVNDTLRLDVIKRAVTSADNWLDWYGEDGGCDEGPSYWYEAAGRLIQFLFYMSSASKHHMDWSSKPLIKSIGDYIYKMHIDKNYFVNFADAAAKQVADPTLIYHYGQLFNNSLMKQFGSYIYEFAGGDHYFLTDGFNGHLHQYFMELDAYPHLKTETPKAPQPLESWLPDLQVITLRTREGSPEGLFLGAKAGTNGESHNHNDVGNFILYVNGLPAIIDIGVGVYTKDTFGKHRYDIWYMQSQWHNTPTINGVQQKDGLHYAAHNVTYNKTETGLLAEFKADIAGAYPKEAQVDSWVRKLVFDRKSNVLTLDESYKLLKFVQPFKVHFITILNVTESDGRVLLKDKDVNLELNYDNNLFNVVVEQHKTNDTKLYNIWGDSVNRVTLVSKIVDKLEGNHSIVFKV
ncbi:uncharacterized protein LOC128955195 [Oppia nitens]|uniref:uncharacterized protein LOC128955195 n=1 Tax=Oppia nitens TaxID=1686743 RepID=UPI0023DB07C7|nr:uncharacterized protein LOC128955195 [Oppia nitens]